MKKVRSKDVLKICHTIKNRFTLPIWMLGSLYLEQTNPWKLTLFLKTNIFYKICIVFVFPINLFIYGFKESCEITKASLSEKYIFMERWLKDESVYKTIIKLYTK